MVADNGEEALTKGDGWELNVAAGQIAWTEEVYRLLAAEY